jgi:hypothetical protein
MGWIRHSNMCGQVHVGSYGHVPSCQAPKDAASQGLGTGKAYLQLEAPGHVFRRPGPCLRLRMQAGHVDRF